MYVRKARWHSPYRLTRFPLAAALEEAALLLCPIDGVLAMLGLMAADRLAMIYGMSVCTDVCLGGKVEVLLM